MNFSHQTQWPKKHFTLYLKAWMTSFSVWRQKCDSFLAHPIYQIYLISSSLPNALTLASVKCYLTSAWRPPRDLQCRVASDQKFSGMIFFFRSTNMVQLMQPLVAIESHANTTQRQQRRDRIKFFLWPTRKSECWMCAAFALCARGMHVNFYFINVKSHQKCFGLDFFSLSLSLVL